MGSHGCGCSSTLLPNQGSLCNTGTTAYEAEVREDEKYRELLDNGRIFRPCAKEVQAKADNFLSRVSKKGCRSHNDQPASSFLKQRISIVFQIGNAACIPGTVSDRVTFEEIYYIKFIF